MNKYIYLLLFSILIACTFLSVCISCMSPRIELEKIYPVVVETPEPAVPEPENTPEKPVEKQETPAPPPLPTDEPTAVPFIPAITGVIVEVHTDRGEQSVILIHSLSTTAGLKTGMVGRIFSDPGYSKAIGKFRLEEIYEAGKAAKGKIIQSDGIIEEGFLIRIEVDPRLIMKD